MFCNLQCDLPDLPDHIESCCACCRFNGDCPFGDKICCVYNFELSGDCHDEEKRKIATEHKWLAICKKDMTDTFINPDESLL